MNKEKILGIIPARFESSRFPGKPLADINGRPMIQWVYEGSLEIFEDLVVATDDERIFSAVTDFGGKAIMTSAAHRSGTERCGEALGILEKENGKNYTQVVNIQGDEPLVSRIQLKELLYTLGQNGADIATLTIGFTKEEDVNDPNKVKVVMDKNDFALYFSRSPVPYTRKHDDLLYYKHIGMYAFKAKVLEEICTLKPGKLEIAESLEQLRWLENGYRIKIGKTCIPCIGIDTPEDLERLKKQLI